jgi:Kef-type K+ transport system membrane component KefB/Trk K+ transport system NAD-binding subunit
MGESVFFQMAMILGLAAAIGGVGIWLKQPLIVSFIAVGILSGPDGLNLVEASTTLDLLADLGIALLLFVVGLKLDLVMIRTMGPVALATGLGQVIFTSVIGFLIAMGLGMELVPALYVAVALTFSSTIIIVKLLTDKKEIDSLHGRIAVGFLIVQDIMVVVALILLSSLGGAEIVDRPLWMEIGVIFVKGAFFLTVIGALMKYVLGPLTTRMARIPELLVLFSVTWAVVLAEAGYQLGFSHEVGAFLAGVSLASTPFRETIGNRLTSLRDFMLLFFFIQLGGGLELSLLGAQVAPASIFSAFVLIGNPVIVMVIMGLMGYRKRTGFLAGLTVAQISEFSLILGALGVAVGHLSQEAMGLITLVGLITIAASTYLILYSYPIYEKIAPLLSVFERKIPYAEEAREQEVNKETFDVILLGLGSFGNHIAKRLISRGRRVLGVDFDPQVVARWRENGYAALYGDIEDPDLFEHLPLKDAGWVVAAMPIREGSIPFIRRLREAGYTGKVAATVETESEEALCRMAGGTGDPEDDAALCRAAGADLILRPFEDAADQAADALTAASEILQKQMPWPVSMEEVRLRPGSLLCGKRLKDIDLRSETGASIVAVSRAGRSYFDLNPDFQLFPWDHLVIAGEPDNLRRAHRYLSRTKARDRAMDDINPSLAIDMIELKEDSAWIGKTPAELDLRKIHGISIIALKRGDQNITAPDSHICLQAGDMLFVIRGRDADG